MCTSPATFPQRGRICSFNVTLHIFPSAGGGGDDDDGGGGGSGGYPVLRKHRAETNIFFGERGHPYSSALSGLCVYAAARGEKSFYKRGCFLLGGRPYIYARGLPIILGTESVSSRNLEIFFPFLFSFSFFLVLLLFLSLSFFIST